MVSGLARKNPRATVRRMLSVYNGQVFLGVIEEGMNCVCRDADGNKIGTFANRKAAQDAFFTRKAPAETGTLMVEG
jgi:hypothetical protein